MEKAGKPGLGDALSISVQGQPHSATSCGAESPELGLPLAQSCMLDTS